MKPSARLAAVLDDLLRHLREIEKSSLGRHLPKGVTLGDVRVLRAIDRVGAAGVSAVADFLGTSQPAATVAVARLETRGMVARAANATDGRRKALTLTTKGRQIETAHVQADGDAAEVILAKLPKQERAALLEALLALASHEPAA